MKKVWLKIKHVILGQLAERAHRRFRRYRDELIKTQIELGEMLPPERRQAIRDELDRMMENSEEFPRARTWN